MDITPSKLQKAVDAEIISPLQAQALIDFLNIPAPVQSSLTVTNFLYYFGGFIAIGSLSVFMTLGWEQYGSIGLFILSLSYALLGIGLANSLKKKKYHIPAGICATFTVCLTPLIIYSGQKILGLWPDTSVYQEFHRVIHWEWIYMELGTLLIGVILAWYYRYPFMVMPIAVTLWYMSMDVIRMLYGVFDISHAAYVSMYNGLLIMALAFYVDLRSSNTHNDYAFWLYLFGIIAFWGGLSSQPASNEWAHLIYWLINLLLIVIGIILDRKIFIVFGVLGSCYYWAHLAFKVFATSFLFPVILAALGLVIIYLGILWHQYEAQVATRIRALLPKKIQYWLERKYRNSR